MKAIAFRVLFFHTILLFPVAVQAQTPSNVQGYPEVGAPTYNYSGAYSALYLDASQFCASGFDFTAHSCKTGGSMWQAIASAIASPLNISGVIDARAFQGNQIIPNGIGTAALYGCYGGSCAVAGVSGYAGSQVNGVLLLGNVTNFCDGIASGYYTDGNGSNYGTPCVIVPWGFQIVGATQSTNISSTIQVQVTFAPCIGFNNPANVGCTTAFPTRSFLITAISVSGTTMSIATSPAPVIIGGPAGSQTLYPATTAPSCPISPNQTDSGELVAIASTTASYSFLRTVLCASGSGFTVAVPSNTPQGSLCSSGSCGTAYLVTPLIGFGVQNNSSGTACNTSGTTNYLCAYEPVRVAQATSQSFATRLNYLAFDLLGTPGAVAAQNLNGGENSGMDTIYCVHPSMGCIQIGPGANESGPYNNVYVQTQAGYLYAVGPTTFGIYNGAAGAGFHRFTMTSNHTVTNHPIAAIYDDGSNADFDGEPHNEGTIDTIDIAPNTIVAGIRINGIVGPPNGTGGTGGNPGTNLVHILNDGYKVTGSTITNLTQQFGSPNGSTYAVADDINNNNDVMDQFLFRYELDQNGNPISGATSQTNNAITTINGTGAIIAAGGLTLPGTTTAATTVGTSNTNQNLTLAPNGSGKVVVSGTGGIAPANAALDLATALTPWRNLFLYGSGAFGSVSFKVTGIPTGNDVLNLPDTAGGTDTLVAAATTQTLTNKSIAASEVNSGKLAIANGGTNSANGAVTVIPSGTSTSGISLPAASSTLFQGMGTGVWTASGCSTEAQCEVPVPASGTFCGLNVVTDSLPPYTVTVTLRTGTNGSMSPTSLSCQLPTMTNTYCDDVAHTATAIEGGGNVMDLGIVTGSGTASTRRYYASVKICGAN